MVHAGVFWEREAVYSQLYINGVTKLVSRILKFTSIFLNFTCYWTPDIIHHITMIFTYQMKIKLIISAANAQEIRIWQYYMKS